MAKLVELARGLLIGDLVESVEWERFGVSESAQYVERDALDVVVPAVV